MEDGASAEIAIVGNEGGDRREREVRAGQAAQREDQQDVLQPGRSILATLANLVTRADLVPAGHGRGV